MVPSPSRGQLRREKQSDFSLSPFTPENKVSTVLPSHPASVCYSPRSGAESIIVLSIVHTHGISLGFTGASISSPKYVLL